MRLPKDIEADLLARGQVGPKVRLPEQAIPCGGCGQTDPEKRCLGCMHEFHPHGQRGEEGARKPAGGPVLLSLPWPPSVNHYWRHVDGKVLISAKGRDYRIMVRSAVTEATLMGGNYIRCDGRLGVIIHAYPPDHRKRDLDNLLKSCLDALCHAGVMMDDEQIDCLFINREAVVQGGRLDVQIRALRRGQP